MPRKPPARRKKTASASPGRLTLYVAALAGGVVLGVQAHRIARSQPARPLAAPTASARAPVPGPAHAAERDPDPARDPKPAAPAAREEKPSPSGEPAAASAPAAAPERPAEPAGPAASGGPAAGPGTAAPADPVTPIPPAEIDRGAGRRPEVALTFDAGADYRPAKKIIEALAAEGVKCSFFLTGEWVAANPKTTRLIASEGHEIGNHSWSHPDFTRLSDEEIRSQLRRTEEVIRQTVGVSSRPYFRPPLGARDRRVLKVLGSEGFLSIYWTLDSRDSVDRGITAAQIRDRVLGKIAPGSIVLMHCGSQATADALPEILQGLRARGLAVVPVSRLLEE